MKIILLPLLISVCTVFTTFGQNIHQKVPLDSLLKDFDILRFNLEKVHAGLNTYKSEKEFDGIFNSYKNNLKEDLTPMEFYQKIGVLVKEIGDAHTEIEPPESFYDALNQESLVLPVSVKWISNSLYIIKDFSNERLTELGDEILSINGVPAQEVFENLREFVPRDGNNLTSPNHALSGVFGQFRNYYASIYGTPDTFQLHILKANGKKENISVNGLKYKSIISKYKQENSNLKIGNSEIPLEFEIKDQVAILKVKSFHPGQIDDANQNFKKFFKHSFKQIAKLGIEKLVIDIRGNGGGHESVFIELFSYLNDKPFRPYRHLKTITNKIPNPELYLEENQIANLEKWANKNLTKEGNDFFVTNEIGVKFSKPQKTNFKGDLIVLIDGKSSSAAGDFSGLVKAFDRAIFVGEETGGNPYMNTAGVRLTLVLPNSGLQIIIPTLLYIIDTNELNNGFGLQPDYHIELKIDDVISGKDKMLEFAMAQLKN